MQSLNKTIRHLIQGKYMNAIAGDAIIWITLLILSIVFLEILWIFLPEGGKKNLI